jgi:hypothetical protein
MVVKRERFVISDVIMLVMMVFGEISKHTPFVIMIRRIFFCKEVEYAFNIKKTLMLRVIQIERSADNKNV